MLSKRIQPREMHNETFAICTGSICCTSHVFKERNMFVSIYTFMAVKAARDLKHFISTEMDRSPFSYTNSFATVKPV